MEKEVLRNLVLKKRDEVSHLKGKESDAVICDKLIKLNEVQNAKTIFSYMAIGSEVSLTKLHSWAKDLGKTVAVPVAKPDGTMDFYTAASDDCFCEGNFGIIEPIPEESIMVTPESADVVIVPAIAFDKDKNRIGHGMGYYDRYLKECKNAVKIIVAYSVQEVDKIPVDEYDIACDIVITD